MNFLAVVPPQVGVPPPSSSDPLDLLYAILSIALLVLIVTYLEGRDPGPVRAPRREDDELGPGKVVDRRFRSGRAGSPPCSCRCHRPQD